MGVIDEFKDFAAKGNMVDMAVGIVMGGAFGTIIKSLVDDILMPPIGMLMGGVDFSNIKLTLKDAGVDEAGEAVEAVTMNVGLFINSVIAFLIVAFALFIVIKGMNNMKKRLEEEEAAAPPPAPPKSEVLLEEIRDALKSR